jgi:hypothetical protein
MELKQFKERFTTINIYGDKVYGGLGNGGISVWSINGSEGLATNKGTMVGHKKEITSLTFIGRN